MSPRNAAVLLLLLPWGASAVRVEFDNVPTGDAALKLAVEELRDAVKARGAALDDSGEGRRILLRGTGAFRNDRDVASQAFTIEPAADGLRVSSPGIGLVYGVFRLAECIRRDGLDWKLRLDERPAFAERMFSYQGVVFDLPDEGYYFRDAPYVNEARLAKQVGYAKEAMRRVLALGFNSITFLNLNIEDYVDYDLLEDGRRVYGPDSLHRKRSAVFRRALTELAEYAHQLHMQLFLQIYEFSFPDHLDGTRLSDDSEFAWKFVEAKFRELFERAPLDGIVVTATEPSPRLNYRGFILWKTPEGAGRMASRYHDVIVKKAGRRLIFRLWRVALNMERFRKVLSSAPQEDLMYETKHSDGDFFLSVGENQLIPNGAARLRPFMVTFDTFRSYDGWGKLIFYPAFWGERFRSSQRNGAVAVEAWGPWAPGCIYPGVWVDKYDYYDYFRHGFGTPLAALYLFARLSWNPSESVDKITDDWAALHFGRKNAEPLRKALYLSYDLWKETFLDPHPYSQLAFKWAMVFQLRDTLIASMFERHDAGLVKKSGARALALAGQVRGLIYSLDARAALHPGAVREFRRAADLTLLYFETFTRWRELVFRAHGLKQCKGDKASVARLADELEELLPEWRKFPREAKDWMVFEFDPDMDTSPDWMKRTSVADTIRDIREQYGLKPVPR